MNAVTTSTAPHACALILCRAYNKAMASPVLEVHDLNKRYGSTTALDGVTLTVNQGEVFGLLGPNGAGKTTFLSIVAGLLPPDAGQVKLLGRPFHRTDRTLRRQLGIVPQELAIYGELT